MNTPAAKKTSRATRLLMMALTVVLIFLFLNVISLVGDIQGTARVVNYAGLVRGTTQRIVKLEDAGQPQDKLLDAVDSYINGLRYGSEELDLVRLDDDEYQAKMTELADYFVGLRAEIARVREVGYENTGIIAKSEEFFGICDKATKLAEDYSQEKATALNRLENFVITDIVALVATFAAELARAVRFAALNRQLQKKVYLDESTGLPNKNKCEEVLAAEEPIPADAPVAVCVFDLNNLRTINNNLGHEKGDEYIRSFAQQLSRVASDTCFVGRDGGDEFIAVLQGGDRAGAEALLARIRANADEYSRAHPDMAISYAAGYALSDDFDEPPTMRDLFRQADKNMYIDKNRAKMAEAAEVQRQNRLVLGRVEAMGYRFSDCLYCDAKLDQYRVLRASSDMFLAESGSYSGAVEQIADLLAEDGERATLRRALQPGRLAQTLGPDSAPISMLYHSGERRGRLSVVFLDGETGLHHFVVGLEPFRSAAASEKQQLSRYYDQMKQSILENGDYVEALLDSSRAGYSVDLTNDALEKVFSQPSGNRFDLDLHLPCSYDEYCRRRSRYVTEDTLESFRLADTAEKLLQRFSTGENQVTIEYRERTRDGGSIWLQKSVLMSLETVYGGDGAAEGVPVVRGIILFKDTSAFHEHEQQEKDRLERALRAVDSENKAKTEFMNRMSHDFRTPINGILGMLEIVKMSGGDPKKTEDCLDKINISARHLLDLVNDVLDMNKLESGKAVLEQDRFELEELMHEVSSLVDAQMAEAGLVHRRHREGVAHTKLIGSDLRLRQIMLNLMSNAIKYNKPGGTVDTWCREISSDGETALFEFKIEDTGIGMSKDFLENKLFRPFTQEEAGPRTHYKGTGLGMSIVKTLIDAMGGTIAVQSTQSVGTTIAFRLAFKIDAEASDAEALPSPDGSGEGSGDGSLAGKRVLLVEDNDLNMEIAEFYLSNAGAAVVMAWNGKEAVEAFADSKPGSFSLVLMDLMMPVMDGLEATRAIRALDRSDAATVPIVAMTANAFEEDREKTRAAGMNAHLVKPLSMETLVAAASELCG